MVYATQEAEQAFLKAADAALDKATMLDPGFISAWHSWANILVRIGAFYDDAVYCHQADEKFAQADLAAKEGKHIESLYWHWGVSAFSILGSIPAKQWISLHRSRSSGRRKKMDFLQASFTTTMATSW